MPTATDMLPTSTSQSMSQQPEGPQLSPSTGSSVHGDLATVKLLPLECSVLAGQQRLLPASDAMHVASAAAIDGAALGRPSGCNSFRSVGGSQPAEEGSSQQVGQEMQPHAQEEPRRRSWLRPGCRPTQGGHSRRPSAVDGTSEGATGDEADDLVRVGSGRRRGGWFRSAGGVSDQFSDDARGSSFAQVDWDETNLPDEKAPGAPDGVSPPPPSGFPRLGGWLRSVRGASPDGGGSSAQGSSLAGLTNATIRGALQSAGGTVITVENEELDAFAKELRQQFIDGELELPTVVLHVDAEGGELEASHTSASAFESVAAGGSSPTAGGAGTGQLRRLRQLMGRGHSHVGDIGTPPAAAATSGAWNPAEAPGGALPVRDAHASTTAASSAEGEVLNERQKQVLFQTRSCSLSGMACSPNHVH